MLMLMLIFFFVEMEEKVKNKIIIIKIVYSFYLMQFINLSTYFVIKAKSVELDEKIPFITKLKRYSGLSNRTEEFTKVEN